MSVDGLSRPNPYTQGMRLSSMSSGAKGSFRIQSVNADGPLAERMLEMGFCVGLTISVHGRLPFSGPWLVEIGTTVLALRNEEADALVVESV